MFNGAELRRIRESRELSRDRLARDCEPCGLTVTATTIQNWELQRTQPRASDIEIVARVLEVPLASLFSNDEPEDQGHETP